MSKTENFIREQTKRCSEGIRPFEDWLTPEQAKKAVEIAREEMTKKACDAYCKVCGHYAHTTPTHICRQACDYYEDFRNYIKGEEV